MSKAELSLNADNIPKKSLSQLFKQGLLSSIQNLLSQYILYYL